MPRAGPSRSQTQHQSQRAPRRTQADEDDGDVRTQQFDMDVDVTSVCPPSLFVLSHKGAFRRTSRGKRTIWSGSRFSQSINASLCVGKTLTRKVRPFVFLVLPFTLRLVLGSNTRAFNAVFERAQKILQKTFAMELVELQSRNYREEDAEDRNATGVKKKGRRHSVPRSRANNPTLL